MSITSAEEFQDTPQGWYQRWLKEMNSAEKRLATFMKRGASTLEKFLDKRDSEECRRLNLFHSNVTTLRSFLFGNAPKSDVSRRHADANDDISRVAAEILNRLINSDIEESGNDFTAVLQAALDDRLLPGLGIARVRYVLDTGMREIDPYISEDGEEVTEEEYLISEEAKVEYVHWRDVRWGFARTWKDLPWMAFRSFLTKDEIKKRFGAVVAERLEYKEHTPGEKDDATFADSKDSWQKAEVWEIWSKEHRKCFWWSQGYDQILDIKDDPLKLKGFWPTPKWMLANCTTTLLEPIPDYYFAQDLYQEIDAIEYRITCLTEAVKAVGVYDESAKGVARMLQEGFDNQLIPITDWQRFSEKGGLEGVIDWMPLADIVAALDKLNEMLERKVRLLYQVTGLSDILRGAETTANRVSASEQKLKAKFGSIRIQAFQDQFAQFASELAALKAEVICKHFSEQTIVDQSGIQYTPDQQLIAPALQMLKENYDRAAWRIEIKPETVAMTDYAQLQQERTEYLNGLAVFLQSSVPLIQLHPQAAPVLLEMLKWGLAGFKGSQQIEGVLDRAIEEVSKPQQPKPDPEEAKAKAEIEKAKMDMAQSREEHQFNMREKQTEHQFKMKELSTKHQQEMREMQLDAETDIAKTQASLQQTALKGYVEMIKGEQSDGKVDSRSSNSRTNPRR